ncbi:pilus assembly protein TadG-related protein [Streptomyces sp. NBC_00091]|uniref:pilus assembly protein TadG-related protein n=1 Tax=Streptomyces sp. NBC_00091 TaxID=2975648 RepID=UPI00224D37FD|nr:pilus assembly protein TadG-related protein [Streptomyces sp. NBC_00091]MCX5376232.1 pilus assembly protein TadG-related protein [Streptomyces sp. NBC_00091]
MRDRGQAFPIYVVVVAGLLFAALAFFVVGQAAVTRSDAQGAADAAALAAGREARDKVLFGLDLTALKPEDWRKIADGDYLKANGACAQADVFAGRNDARAQCEASPPRFTVKVESNRTVGDSVIPGTNSMHGSATATALVESKCHLGTVATPSPAPTVPAGGSTPGPTPTASTAPAVTFACDKGDPVKLDPMKPGSLRELGRKLFSVRLVD